VVFSADFFIILGFYFWAIFSFVSNSLLSLHHACILLSLFYSTKLFNNITRPRWSIVFLFFLGLAASISIFSNWSILEHPLKNLFKTKYFYLSALLAWLLSLSPKNFQKNWPSLSSVFLLSFTAANIYGIGLWTYKTFALKIPNLRLGGFFSMELSYSNLAVYPLFLLLYLLLFKQGVDFRKDTQSKLINWVHTKKIYTLMLLLGFFGLYLSKSRGAIIAFLMALPTLIYFKNKKIFYGSLVLSLSIILFWLSISLSGSSTNRLFLSLNSNNAKQRIAQASVAWHGFLENPVFGEGYRALQQRDRYYKDKYDIPFKEFNEHAHNNFLEILASTGLVGFLCFILFWAFWIREILITSSMWGKGFFIASIAASLVAGLFQSTIIDSEVVFTLLALFAISHAFIKVPAKEA
jgi:O-antigen ligase